MKKFVLIFVLFIIFFNCSNERTLKLDLSRPEDKLLAFVKMRGSLEEKDVVFYWSGSVYSYIPEERSKRLFQFEGFNVGRMEPLEGGYQLLTREAAFYEDIQTGEILEEWENPFTNERNEVVQVWNDPVNQKFFLKTERGMFNVPTTEVGEDKICWHFEIFLNYPSPLPRSEFPEYSQSDMYQGGEMFQFFTERKDLENADLYSVPTQISWTRLGPWLPWMEMGDKPGMLVYQCRGMKLKNGFMDLPEHIKEYVEKHNPKFKTAPDRFTAPNETSWTYFKKKILKED